MALCQPVPGGQCDAAIYGNDGYVGVTMTKNWLAAARLMEVVEVCRYCWKFEMVMPYLEGVNPIAIANQTPKTSTYLSNAIGSTSHSVLLQYATLL